MFKLPDINGPERNYGLPRQLTAKESACQCRSRRLDHGLGRFPWSRKWQPSPVFLPGKSHGQRSLAATVHGFAKSSTRLSDFTFTLTFHFHALEKEMATHSSVAQSCATLCDPMDSSPPGSSVHGIFQVRKLEWVTTAYSTGSSQSRNRSHTSCVSCIGREILFHCATWEAQGKDEGLTGTLGVPLEGTRRFREL